MNIIVTTTDCIENHRIAEYIDILRSSSFVGTELALTDLFADPTRKYRRKLDTIYDGALQEIRQKALAVGADAVVGVHTDFQEIFSKGKARFLVSVVGTAVRLERKPEKGEELTDNIVTQYRLRRSQLQVVLRRKLENESFNPDAKDWENIIRYALYDLASMLYKRYLVLASETISSVSLVEKKLFLDNFVPFLRGMDYESAAEVVYGDTETAPFVFCKVVKECNLFYPQKVASIMTSENKHTVIALLDSDKPLYTKEDLKYMISIAEYLDNLPDTGRYIEGRDGLFAKSGTLLVCERGHTSAVELGGHCTCQLEGSGAICNLNVKGITEQEVAAIEAFKTKIEILKSELG
jgi:uncharacterized protein YbjQ (UPF0145 family)